VLIFGEKKVEPIDNRTREEILTNQRRITTMNIILFLVLNTLLHNVYNSTMA